MKSRRVLFWVMVACAYVAATALLWPLYLHHQLPIAAPATPASNVDAQAELAHIPAEAPLTLITEPDAGIAPITDAIAHAQKSIDLVIYELEDQGTEQALLDAQNRGVAVRVLIQNVSNFGKHPNQAAYDFLQTHGVPIKWAPAYFPLTHQKTLAVDQVRAYIMTFNLTPQYYQTSRDFAVVDDGATDVAAIEQAFASDWNGSRAQANSASDLVWSPGSADTLLALIGEASSTLDVYNEEMADSRVTQALAAAAARGVAVRVTMTYETNWKPALMQLVASGVHVRTYASSAKFYIHAKAVIADGTTAFVGSENFSPQSLDQNRELGILITRPDILSSLESTFAHDYAAARLFNADGTSNKN